MGKSQAFDQRLRAAILEALKGPSSVFAIADAVGMHGEVPRVVSALKDMKKEGLVTRRKRTKWGARRHHRLEWDLPPKERTNG